jgi:hypothetical protein
MRTVQQVMGHESLQMLMRYLKLANSDTLATRRTNNPADRHHAQRRAGVRRLPMRSRSWRIE